MKDLSVTTTTDVIDFPYEDFHKIINRLWTEFVNYKCGPSTSPKRARIEGLGLLREFYYFVSEVMSDNSLIITINGKLISSRIENLQDDVKRHIEPIRTVYDKF